MRARGQSRAIKFALSPLSICIFTNTPLGFCILTESEAEEPKLLDCLKHESVGPIRGAGTKLATESRHALALVS
jgi:hypothetical protein